MSKSFVAYYRVSTQRQGKSGLGLDAQRADVARFSQDKGKIVAEFTEVETGKNNSRPQLQAAIGCAIDKNATLLIAKLDRLSRDAEFIFHLRNSQVDFVCVDIPDANTLTIGFHAVLAQHERELISSRTKAALQAKKEQGFRLGTPGNLSQAARQRGALAMQHLANQAEANRRAFAVIGDLRRQGLSYAAIAGKLNEYGLRTVRGKSFSAMAVRRIWLRFQKK